MKIVAILATSALTLGACAMLDSGGSAPATASANLRPTKGNPTAGTVTFRQTGNKVVVRAEVSGLKAGSEFGFHVHEKGDCSAPDGTSAGGHFNPGNKAHGHYAKDERHAGDLPNLRSNGEGLAELNFETTLLAVQAGPTSVVGRAVVVHASPDDYTSQPAGNSGARIACGVIVAAS